MNRNGDKELRQANGAPIVGIRSCRFIHLPRLLQRALLHPIDLLPSSSEALARSRDARNMHMLIREKEQMEEQFQEQLRALQEILRQTTRELETAKQAQSGGGDSPQVGSESEERQGVSNTSNPPSLSLSLALLILRGFLHLQSAFDISGLARRS